MPERTAIWPSFRAPFFGACYCYFETGGFVHTSNTPPEVQQFTPQKGKDRLPTIIFATAMLNFGGVTNQLFRLKQQFCWLEQVDTIFHQSDEVMI